MVSWATGTDRISAAFERDHFLYSVPEIKIKARWPRPARSPVCESPYPDRPSLSVCQRRAVTKVGKPRPVIVVQSEAVEILDAVAICPFTTDPAELPLFRLDVAPTGASGLRAFSSVGRLSRACRLIRFIRRSTVHVGNSTPNVAMMRSAQDG